MNAEERKRYWDKYYAAKKTEINAKRREYYAINREQKRKYRTQYRREQKMTELMQTMTQLAQDMIKLGEKKHVPLMREQFFACKGPEEAQNLLKEWGAPVRKYRHVKTNKPCQEW